MLWGWSDEAVRDATKTGRSAVLPSNSLLLDLHLHLIARLISFASAEIGIVKFPKDTPLDHTVAEVADLHQRPVSHKDPAQKSHLKGAGV